MIRFDGRVAFGADAATPEQVAEAWTEIQKD